MVYLCDDFGLEDFPTIVRSECYAWTTFVLSTTQDIARPVKVKEKLYLNNKLMSFLCDECSSYMLSLFILLVSVHLCQLATGYSNGNIPYKAIQA